MMWIGFQSNYFKRQIAARLKWFKGYLLKNLPVTRQDMELLASYIFCVGIMDWLLQRSFMHQASDLYFQWTIGFRPEFGPTYNTSFISYLMGVVGLIGGLLGVQLLGYSAKLKQFCVMVNEKIWGKVFGLSLFLSFVAPFQLAHVCFIVVVAVLGLRMFLHGAETSEKTKTTSGLQRGVLYAVLIGLIGFSLWQGIKAWYPVVLANDYIEIPDQIGVPPDGAQKLIVYLDHDMAINCILEQQRSLSKFLGGDVSFTVKKKDASSDDYMASVMQRLSKALDNQTKDEDIYKPAPCNHTLTITQASLLNMPLKQIGSWQSQSGRAFYHHSYIYVPAAHLLKYGLGTPIPYLYGLGNTLFHAALLYGKPLTLTNYFETYPIAQLVGVAMIVLAVFFMFGNVWVIPAAFAATLIPLWFMGYENIQLAPGFSPLRYAGLAMQMASIFVLCNKQNGLRVAGLLVALCFSLFWNKEFAVIGLFGQLLCLIAPQLRIGNATRIVAIGASLVITAGLMTVLGSLSQGFLETIQVGIFGISMPPWDNGDFLNTCFYVLIAAGALTYAAYRFNGSDRTARLCMIPVLALLMIKYIYNSSPIHLLYTLAFILPMSLAYLDWNNAAGGWISKNLTAYRRQRITMFTLAILVVVCAVGAMHYKRDSVERRSMLVDMFQKNDWKELGETFQAVTPADPIVSRMKAVQEQVGPNDAVLFLSPFDHLMSFYGNPKSFCGHFEYLTNLVTLENVAMVAECARSNPNALVVYDDTVEQKCPRWDRNFFDQGSCSSKQKLMLTLQTMMASLKPDLVLVKKVGPLSFYRNAAANAVPVNANESAPKKLHK